MDKVNLYHCSVSELWRHVDGGSVDIILTDPPYPKEYLDCYRDLAEFAAYTLKPGGHLLAMSGHAWLPELFERMNVAGLRYQWMLCVTPMHPSATNLGRRIKRIQWKPILWYIKPTSNIHEQLHDVIHTKSGGRDKRFHFWGQGTGEFDYLLHQLRAGEGTVVCDPFLGGGTTAESAYRAGCHFIGCDIDATCLETTRTRLMTLQTEFDFEEPHET